MGIVHEITAAARSLRRSPGFAATAVLILALGAGVNTAIFSFVHAVLLAPLPLPNPEQLVVIGASSASTGVNTSFSYPMFRDIAAKNDVFAGLLARSGVTLQVGLEGRSERVYGDLVSGTYFETLGVQPFLGRLFTREDDVTPSAHPVAVVSHAFWRNQLGGDSAIVNRELVLNGRKITVVGVAPPGFYGTELASKPDVFLPLMMAPEFRPQFGNRFERRNSQWLTLMARLKQGVSREQAQGRLTVLHQALLEEEIRSSPRPLSQKTRDEWRSQRIYLSDGSAGFGRMRRMLSPSLKILIGATGAVLLIACANLAGLLLARSAVRRREMALRTALGASRFRLIRQAMMESLLLSLGGAAAGLLAAVWTTSALVRFLPPGTSLSSEIAWQPQVLAFHLSATMLAGILFGLVPAVHSSQVDVAPELKGESPGGRRSGIRMRGALIVAQVALSVLLLASASLFLESLRRLRSIDMGFDRRSVVQAELHPGLAGYKEQRLADFYAAVVERVRTVPGFESAALGTTGVISGSWDSNTVIAEGYQGADGGGRSALFNGVSAAYFRTLGIPLLAGRDFAPGDMTSSMKTAVVNEQFVREFFGGGNALGKRIGMTGADQKLDIEIVGVVRDSKFVSLRENLRPFVYLPVTHWESPAATLYVRSRLDLGGVTAAVREHVRAADPNVAVTDFITLDTQVNMSLTNERLLALLSSAFGALAAVLASVGLYALLAFTVSRRTREIGIRMALGAEASDAAGMIFRHTARLVGLGLALGSAASWYATRFAAPLLYEVKPGDPVAWLGPVSLLGAASLIAAWLPARRAAHVDPMIALRYE